MRERGRREGGSEGGVFTHGRVTPPVSGDLQERSCCSLPLAVTLFGFTPSLSFRGGFSVFSVSILLFIRGDTSKKVRLNDELFGLSVKSFPCEARDVGEDIMRHCNNRVSAEHRALLYVEKAFWPWAT